LVSIKGLPADVLPITPAISSVATHKAPSSVILVRKLQIVGKAAIALAGRGDVIRDCVRKFEEISRAEVRPTRWLAGAASEANRMYGRVLEALCASPMPGPQRGMFLTAPRELQEMEGVGPFIAIGSGGEDLLNLYKEMTKKPDFCVNQLHDIVALMNGIRLVHEIVGEAKNGWGGYIEYAVWNGEKWIRGADVLHLFVYFFEKNGRREVARVSKVLAYKKSGRVLGISDPDDAQGHIHDYQFESLLENPDGQGGYEISDWEGWVPQVISLTVFGNHDGNTLSTMGRTLDEGERKNIAVQFNSKNLSIRFSDNNFLRDLSLRVIEDSGLDLTRKSGKI